MSSKGTIRLLQLYPKDMNIYGDWGNTLTLLRRLQWHGYEVELLEYNLGDVLPDDIDIIIGGGGQDSGQTKISEDLLAIGPRLIQLANEDVPMLLICGLYQQFGHFFKTKDGTIIPGIGLFDSETTAGDTRMIGNTIIETDEFGLVVGYENHSGKTTLRTSVSAFGKVRQGAGNNGSDGSEGARYRNVIGTYLHGSLLPKNPRVADFLIGCAVRRKYGTFQPAVIDDTLAEAARTTAMQRPR